MNDELKVRSVRGPQSMGTYSHNLGKAILEAIEGGRLLNEQSLFVTKPMYNIVKNTPFVSFTGKDGRTCFSETSVMNDLILKSAAVKNGWPTGEFISAEHARKCGAALVTGSVPVVIPISKWNKERGAFDVEKDQKMYNVAQFEDPEKIRAYADKVFREAKEEKKAYMEEHNYEHSGDVRLDRDRNKFAMKSMNVPFSVPKNANSFAVAADLVSMQAAATAAGLYLRVAPEEKDVIQNALRDVITAKTKDDRQNVFAMANVCRSAANSAQGYFFSMVGQMKDRLAGQSKSEKDAPPEVRKDAGRGLEG